MTPTMKLRFVERDIGGKREPPKYVYVLQQWWKYDPDHDGGVWVDVPLETEE